MLFANALASRARAYVCMYVCMYVCICACRDSSAICVICVLSSATALWSLRRVYLREIRNRRTGWDSNPRLFGLAKCLPSALKISTSARDQGFTYWLAQVWVLASAGLVRRQSHQIGWIPLNCRFIRFSFGFHREIAPSRLVCIEKSNSAIVFDGEACDEG